jgi:hypothetical protein
VRVVGSCRRRVVVIDGRVSCVAAVEAVEYWGRAAAAGVQSGEEGCKRHSRRESSARRHPADKPGQVCVVVGDRPKAN